ncbi:FecCD family ABC transporter permease [Nocardioides plantarum]|uniref:FecCD family ABC transporter permease n=1 Tax=Nocardioides plantarum TaxID=29299 RepID=A0ABV5KES0_9ACTN|nr:iron ABC transporter permease [Nocardioides plantarum]
MSVEVEAPLAEKVTAVGTPIRVGPLSWQVPVRSATIAVASLGVVFLLFCLDLGLGDVDISLGRTIRTLFGYSDPGAELIITDLRLPQTTVALLVGMALGLAGALTQTFARNPLASPDILGVTEGASAGAVAVIVLAGSSGFGGGLVTGRLQTVGLPLAAFAGGLLTAMLLYALAWRRGIDGQRLVLIGIGIGAALTAVVEWLLLRARITDAQSAQVWLNGSLNSRGWDQARPVVVALVVLVPLSFWLVRHLNALQLGDDSARVLGVRLQTTQLLVLVCAVGLAAVSVSAVGPLEFVALVVPQVALRLAGGARPPLLSSMLLGGALVLGADLVTRVVIPFSLPAGVVTAAIGAPYLIYLLVRAKRKVAA